METMIPKSEFHQLLEKYDLPRDRRYFRRDEQIERTINSVKEYQQKGEMEKIIGNLENLLRLKKEELDDPENQDRDVQEDLKKGIANYEDRLAILRYHLQNPE